MARFGHLSNDVLSAFADDECAPAELEAVRGHLASCSACAERLESFSAFDGSLRDADCEAVRPLLSAELDGELDSELAAFVRQHALSCSGCRATRSAWTEVDATVRHAPAYAPSRRVDEAIALLGRRDLVRRPAFAFAAARGALRIGIAMAVVLGLASGSVLIPGTPAERVTSVPPGAAIVASAQSSVLDARTNTLYAVATAEGLVVYRDASSDLRLGAIVVGGRPDALALNAERNVLYVLDTEAKTITEIDTTQRSVVRTDSLALSGTPTSVNVDTNSGKVLVTSASAAAGTGQLTVIDAASRRVDVTRDVDVRPGLVVANAAAGRTFLLGKDSTLVLDSRTYERVESLPGGALAAAAGPNGVTAILSAGGGGARVSFYGAEGSVSLSGTPLALAAGRTGSFAVLLSGVSEGTRRVVLVDPSGVIAHLDLGVAADQLAYDARIDQFVLLGGGRTFGTIPSSFTSAALDARTPPPARSATPQPSPSATPAPVALATTGPTPEPVPGIPNGARALSQTTYYLEQGQLQPLAMTGRGFSLWFVDQQGGVNLLDTRTGMRGIVARLPGGTTPSLIALGPRTLYVLDRATQTLHTMDLVSSELARIQMPFGRSVVAMDVAPDGRVWFAASTLASLVWFDQLEQRFHLEARDGAGLSVLSARAAGVVWFAYSSGHEASVVARLNLSRGTTDEYRLSGVGDVQALFADERGTLWVSTTVAGLFPFRDGQAGPLLGGSGSGVFGTGPDGSAWFLQKGPAQTRLYKLGDSSAPLPAGARGLTIDANGRAWVADGDNPAFFILRSLGQ